MTKALRVPDYLGHIPLMLKANAKDRE